MSSPPRPKVRVSELPDVATAETSALPAQRLSSAGFWAAAGVEANEIRASERRKTCRLFM